MTSDLKTILTSQMANASSGKVTQKPPVALVDEIADELVKQYANPAFRGWYCGVINKFGVARIREWQRRAEDADSPGRVFTTYVNQAGGYRRPAGREVQ